MVQKNLSVGLFFGWNYMYERVTGQTELNTDPPGTIYGTQDNTINSFPIMASAHYYFGERKQLRPYIGLNAGGSVMLQQKAIGIFVWDNDQWQWGVAPEAGVAIPVERDFGLLINGKYNMFFTGEDAIGNEINNAYWSINVGFIWEP
jgi:outer membrane protein W